jgi:hypothetical protein
VFLPMSMPIVATASPWIMRGDSLSVMPRIMGISVRRARVGEGARGRLLRCPARQDDAPGPPPPVLRSRGRGDPPRSGRLRDYRLADLRRQFAIVLQEPVLFSTSISENIAYGRPGANEAQIIGAHKFISRLPRGYETLVGERGMLLWRRAAADRARARVLDGRAGPTTLEELLRGRTVFLVTHRPGALGVCDMVLEVKDGRLVAPPRRKEP